MLNENIRTIRKSKGLSQEELAIKLNVVRQTVSKWEKGLSVPDSEMLLAISEHLETPVSILLGESMVEEKVADLKVLSEKLEIINLRFSKRNIIKRKMLHWFFIIICAVVTVAFVSLVIFESAYLGWDYTNPQTAFIGVAFQSLEWIFIRIAPFILAGSIVGIILTRKKV